MPFAAPTRPPLVQVSECSLTQASCRHRAGSGQSHGADSDFVLDGEELNVVLSSNSGESGRSESGNDTMDVGGTDRSKFILFMMLSRVW